MPNDKSYGSPYKMKAGKMGPMQKNFGASLAINKKLDKDNMAGGLTGKPSTGELDGPLAKKKGGVKPSNIGAKLKAGQKDRGIFSEKGKAEKKSRKAGESKFQADVRRRGEANRASKKTVAAKPTKNATKNATKNKPTDKEIKVKTKNNLTLGGGSTPKMGNAGDVNRKGTGKYKDNTYTRSGKTGFTSVVPKGGKRIKIKGDIKDYTKKGGNTKIKVKAKEKKLI